ncbi:MAG: IS1595 family transposase, partial [Methylobacteriaceae bacterium]|nr:IS1595 family transposase [Methylobacteriaceae bacterium]
DSTSIADLVPVVNGNLQRETKVMTDTASWYRNLNKTGQFAGHLTVNHTLGEYVNMSDRTIHTNTVEGYYSIFKRGMKGVYQHCSEKHLHRYLAEFDFRYSNRSARGVEDQQRAGKALLGISGKRLKYRGHREGEVGA